MDQILGIFFQILEDLQSNLGNMRIHYQRMTSVEEENEQKGQR